MKYALLGGAFLVAAGLGIAKIKTQEKPSVEIAAATEKLPPAPAPHELPDIPLSHVERPVPKALVKESTASPEELQKEDKLLQNLQDDKAFADVADVENVNCENDRCQVRAEAKGEDNSLIMDRMLKFLMSHPEYGAHFVKEDVKDNPKAILLTVSKEKI